MGWLWHTLAIAGSMTRELGWALEFAGHIDLVDPGAQEVLNLVLLVQSKASGLPFTYETDASFQYTCNENDLNYWLSGNAPVILILSHPERDEAWWVEVKAELADPQRRASRTVVVDKHRQVFNASAAPQFLRRAVPKDKGVFLATPPKPDPDISRCSNEP